MISVISAIHNQKPMNELYYETLVKHTECPFELIIIDNNSTDGSREFFQGKPNVTVICNGGNYNYPYSQNRGLEVAKGDIVCFLNNDVIVSHGWDRHVAEAFRQHAKLKVLSVATNDDLADRQLQKQIHRKWKMIKYPIQFLFGNSKFSLWLMLSLMYGDFQHFCKRRFQKYGLTMAEAFSGSVIIARKDFMLSIGMWDERIQSADFDLFNRVKKLSLTDNSILPIQMLLGVYFHHYQRLTFKKKYPPFASRDSMISFDEKWGEESKILRKDIVG